MKLRLGSKLALAGGLLAGLWAGSGCAGKVPADVAACRTSSPAQSSTLSAEDQLLRCGFDEPLVAVGAKPEESESRELLSIIERYKLAETDQVEEFESFLQKHPKSAWNAGLCLNLGIIYHRTGHYSLSGLNLRKAWNLAQGAQDQRAKALADRALGELSISEAYLGHQKELDQLLQQARQRNLSGSATELVACAAEGFKNMRLHPERSFMCGPNALGYICRFTGNFNDRIAQILGDSRCLSKGTSLSQVQQLSAKVGLHYQMAYRSRGSQVLVPAVVHWKVGHFASLTPGRPGRYHVQDATDGAFGRSVLISPKTLDEEASGYFLIPEGTLPDGWRKVSPQEGATVWGKGDPGPAKVAGGTTNRDKTVKKQPEPCVGMTSWDVHAMEVSLSLADTPVGLSRAAFAVPFSLNYCQREVAQPGNFNYSNFGPKWTCNWIGIITDQIADSGSCALYERGGGLEHFLFANGSNVSKVERFSLSTLTKMSGSSGTTFLRTFQDGSSETYGLASGNKYFLTEVRDSQGNTTKIQFDGQLRIQTITDPVGRVMQLTYAAQDPLKITRVTDFAGNAADFSYTTDGHLASIRDVAGLTSSFHYASNDFVDQLTTPYGTTKFAYGDSSTNPSDQISRFLDITDAAGRKSRVEYTHYAPIAFSEPQIPQGITLWNAYLYSRNTFYWEPQQLGASPDYSKATLFHFTHSLDDVALIGTFATGRTLESMKPPLQNRIWYDHPPGYNPYGVPPISFDGSLDVLTAVARILSDGSTQMVRYSYNDKANVTQKIDAMGRVFDYAYAPNGIDLTSVSTGGKTLMAASYDGNHNIVSLTDSSGGVTNYSYNARGQVTSQTNSLGETTSYEYSQTGNLLAIHEPLQKNTTFSYNSAEQLSSATDSEGYTAQVAYDQMERPTTVTYPDGTTEQLSYSKLDLVQTTDRLGRTTQMSRDALGRLLSLTDANGGVTGLSYGLEDGPNALTDPNGNSTGFQYDLQQRLSAKQFPSGATQSILYEACAGRPYRITDELGHSKTMSYFLDNTLKGIVYSGTTPPVSFTDDTFLPRPLSMTDGTGTTAVTYGAVGGPGANQVTGITGPYGDVASFAYDVAGRPVGQTVNSSSENVTYDALWRPTATTNALDTFTMSYLGKTGQVTGINSTTGPSVAYAYGTNAQDRRLTQIKNLGRSGSALSQFDFQYDAVGQITQLTETIGTATNSTGGGGDCHDKCCHRGKCCHKDKCCKKKCCKGKGECGKERCHQKHDREGDDDDRFGAAPFDLRILNGLLGLGIAGLWGSLLWQFARRPRTTTSRLAQVTSLALVSALALNGCIFSGGGTTTTANVYNFTYDKLGQLVGVNLNQTPTESYVFDKSGNLTGLTSGGVTTSFSYNSLNQQTSPAGKTFDAKGQTTTDGTRTYEWDDQGRITAIVMGTQRTELSYDGMSRRTKITEFTNGAVTSKKLYFWLGGSIVCERDGLQTGFPITKQYFGQGEVRGTTKLYYATDHLGSIRELVDSAGTVQAEYSYSTYGERTKVSGNLDSDWGYAGLWHHQASGLDLAVYRAYDAANKRWISRDPLGEGAGLNLYSYCGNSPTNNVDPAGLRPISDAPWDTPVPVPIGAIQEPPRYPGNPFSGAGDAAKGWGAALGNLGRWLQGKEIQRDFGPDTIQVRQLRNAPGVERARNYYKKKNKGKKCPEAVTNYDAKFGVLEFIDATLGFNGTRHFIGTFSLDIYPIGNDRVYFTVHNTTGRTSAVYQLGVEGTDYGGGRDQEQTYHWEEYLPAP